MPEQHILTPAAVSDDVTAPQAPREVQLLLAVAVTASLPRVLWGLTSDARRLLGESSADLSPLFTMLRATSALTDIACLFLIGLCFRLDKVAPGSHGWRTAAIGLGVFELLWDLLPIASILYGAAGRAGYVLVTLPSFCASLAFALWLAAILKSAGKAPMLVAVVCGATALRMVSSLTFGAIPLLTTLVGVLFAIEVLRARRAIER